MRLTSSSGRQGLSDGFEVSKRSAEVGVSSITSLLRGPTVFVS